MAKLIIKNRYGIAPNEILNNENISLKAKGLYTYLQSKPDGWKFSIQRISIQTKDGKSAIRGAIKELENLGYLKRIPLKDDDGRWNGYDYELSEKPLSEKRTTENPMTENYDTISNKDNSKKDIVIKNTLSKDKVETLDVNYFIDKFKKVNPSYEKLFSNKTQRKAIKNLVDKLGPEKLEKLIDFLPAIFGKPYAPRITTPYQLEEKLGDLIAYIKAERSKKPKIGIIR